MSPKAILLIALSAPTPLAALPVEHESDRAGIAPQIIYAYERTGFLLLEEGYRNLSPEDKAEYDAAIEEYEKQR